MKVLMLIALLFCIHTGTHVVYAASFPEKAVPAPGLLFKSNSKLLSAEHARPVLKNGRLTWKQKLALRILAWKNKRKIGGIDEPTEHQKKLGRLSLMFAVGAIAFVILPYAAVAIGGALVVASLPMAVTSLVLGIKSIKGNTNVPGLIGLILSGSLLVLFLLALVVLAIVLSNGIY